MERKIHLQGYQCKRKRNITAVENNAAPAELAFSTRPPNIRVYFACKALMLTETASNRSEPYKPCKAKRALYISPAYLAMTSIVTMVPSVLQAVIEYNGIITVL